MVRPKPGTPAFRALALIVRDPGQWSASDIGAHLRKPVPRDRPFTSATEYVEWRKARTAFERERDAWASRIVRRLVEAGFVESRGAPAIAEWFGKRVASVGMDAALRRAAPIDSEGPFRHHASLLVAVAKGPSSVSDVLGSSPSGATKRAWSDLIEWACVVPPAARWATARGVAWVEANREES